MMEKMTWPVWVMMMATVVAVFSACATYRDTPTQQRVVVGEDGLEGLCEAKNNGCIPFMEKLTQHQGVSQGGNVQVDKDGYSVDGSPNGGVGFSRMGNRSRRGDCARVFVSGRGWICAPPNQRLHVTALEPDNDAFKASILGSMEVVAPAAPE
ncbi:hypothetical protein HYV73_03575 [Candidatus Uhrbacteria bacterium]|nr:hypothetical protein [Candidatus Uhrbacteria bacterium]